MAIQALLKHPVTIFHRKETGQPADPGFSNLPKDFDGGSAAMAYVEPHFAKEYGTDRETRLTDYDVYLLPHTDVAGIDEIEWNGVRHIIVGRPKLFSTPNGPNHLLLTMRAVEG